MIEILLFIRNSILMDSSDIICDENKSKRNQIITQCLVRFNQISTFKRSNYFIPIKKILKENIF